MSAYSRKCNARFRILLNRIPIHARKSLAAELIRKHTYGRTESLRAVTEQEYDKICDELLHLTQHHPIKENKQF